MDACGEISAPDDPRYVKDQAVAALLVRCQKELVSLTAKVSQLESRLEKQDEKQDRSGSDALQNDAHSANLTSAGIHCSEYIRHDQALPVSSIENRSKMNQHRFKDLSVMTWL